MSSKCFFIQYVRKRIPLRSPMPICSLCCLAQDMQCALAFLAFLRRFILSPRNIGSGSCPSCAMTVKAVSFGIIQSTTRDLLRTHYTTAALSVRSCDIIRALWPNELNLLRRQPRQNGKCPLQRGHSSTYLHVPIEFIRDKGRQEGNDEEPEALPKI